mgnify:CR=1 FL=1
MSREYYDGCMLDRNHRLVEAAGVLLAVYNGERRVFKIEYLLLEQADSIELRDHPRAAEIRIYSYGYRSSDFTLSDFERDWVENDNLLTTLQKHLLTTGF